MADDTLTLALHGEVSLDAFAHAVDKWRDLLNAISREAAPGHSVTWVIADLAAGSATVTARAVGSEDAIRPVASAYEAVGRSLAAGHADAIPAAFRGYAVALATAAREDDVDYMRFETAAFDAIITFNYDVAIEPTAAPTLQAPAALGGVQGRIQTLTNRSGLRVTLYDTLFDRAVSCYLRPDQEELMRDVWGHAAIVEGVVTRDPVTGRPLAIRDVRNVTAVHEVAPDAYRAARGAVRVAQSDRRTVQELIDEARAR